MIKVLSIFGTRPEAIKLAPVLLELRRYPDRFASRVCVTAQHREMLDQVLDLFGIVPDWDLDLMRADQALPELTAQVLTRLTDVLEDESPDLVLVQGDTTTVMAAALAAFYHRIPVGHIEAGLRSGDRLSPFPEEVNRRIASVLATYHFAPTETARQALLAEGVDESSVFVTGNTVVDALHMVLDQPCPDRARALLRLVGLDGNSDGCRLILVTAHRRENFGWRFLEICGGLKALAERNDDIAILYPVHMNPNVQVPVYDTLLGLERIHLTEPVDYDSFVHLMEASTLILTDSGGIHEGAPALGKPVLVLRDETERREALMAGTVRLVAADAGCIVRETERLLNNPTAYAQMARAVSPYGDGHAARRIVQIIHEGLSQPD